MKYQDAKDIFSGQKMFSEIPQLTMGENLMLILDACLDDNGDIICLRCDRLNECCECER